MKTLGEKIRELRNAIGMTQSNLANELGISLKSLQRYENNQSKPDFYALTRLADFFDVSSDYLMGICDLEKEYEISQQKTNNMFYKRYLKCKNNYTIDHNAVYYWIEASGNMVGGQMYFAGWKDKPGGKEIHKLREVIPEKAIEMCTKVKGKPMILNCKEDAIAFMIYEGQAIAKKEVCEKYLPAFRKYCD